MTNLPKWANRTAAVSILFVLLGAVYLFVVGPLVDAYRSADEAIELTGDQLAHYKNISKNYPALKAQLEKLSRRQAASGVYLAGDTDALAAAGLQEDVSATIEKNGGKLRSIQILPVTNDGDFKRVSVRVQLTATLGAFTQILYTLEAGKPVVFVDNLDVKNRRARRTNKDQEQDPELVIRFDLFGYLRPEVS